ncbi:DUF3147 family protein [bacterium]|nr:DUF3147 family protein [bacterium]
MTTQSFFFFIFKAALSGVLIALTSTLAKTFPKWAALLTALPLMTFLSLIWIYVETKDLALLESYTRDVLIWVIPSLIFFVAAIYLFKAKVPFILSMGISTAVLFVGVFIFEKLHFLK